MSGKNQESIVKIICLCAVVQRNVCHALFKTLYSQLTIDID